MIFEFLKVRDRVIDVEWDAKELDPTSRKMMCDFLLNSSDHLGVCPAVHQTTDAFSSIERTQQHCKKYNDCVKTAASSCGLAVDSGAVSWRRPQ